MIYEMIEAESPADLINQLNTKKNFKLIAVIDLKTALILNENISADSIAMITETSPKGEISIIKIVNDEVVVDTKKNIRIEAPIKVD